MINLPDPGLYRTTKPYPGYEQEIPEGALVYVGKNPDTGVTFVVRPGSNRRNRWYWGEPTLSLIHISEPTRLLSISYAVFCLKKKKYNKKKKTQNKLT